MKPAIVIAATLLAAGCATDPARQAAWNARDQNCSHRSWVYKNGEFLCGLYPGASPFQRTEAEWQDPENMRNTPYQNARIDERLALLGAGQ